LSCASAEASRTPEPSPCTADGDLGGSESRKASDCPSLAAGTAIAGRRCARTGGGPAKNPPLHPPWAFSSLISILGENWDSFQCFLPMRAEKPCFSAESAEEEKKRVFLFFRPKERVFGVIYWEQKTQQ